MCIHEDNYFTAQDNMKVASFRPMSCMCSLCAVEIGTFSSFLFYLAPPGGGEIAQLLASLSTKRAIRVRSRLEPLVIDRWNSITVLLTCSHQC